MTFSILGQIPGTDAAIKSAMGSGYEAVVLVVILIAMLAFFGILGRWFISSTDKRLEEARAREDRLARRIDELERFTRDTLLRLVQDVTESMVGNTRASQALTDALNARLCLLDPTRQDDVVDRIGRQLAEKQNDK